MSSRLLASTSTAIALTAVAIIVILFATNLITIANAQQPQQTTNQTAAIENITFQSTRDSFRVQVPDGWVIRDMDNTGFSLLTEVLQGYGVLAQLCPEQEQQAALRNVGSSIDSCQASQQGGGDIIHIIRYPNLGAILRFTAEDITANSNNTLDNILVYEIQKLQEVGYRNIQIVNSTYTTVNFDINAIPARVVPAKLVEITYTTNDDPNDVKTGYFISTATDATAHSPGTITGYSIFYEGNSAAETVASDSLAPTTQQASAVNQVFDSFELIIAPEEAAQPVTAPQAAQTQQTEENDDETNDGDTNNDNDNGGNNNDNDCVVVGRSQSSASDNCDDTPDAE
jgi:hypothetical protein